MKTIYVIFYIVIEANQLIKKEMTNYTVGLKVYCLTLLVVKVKKN